MTPSGGLLASASCIASRIVICVNITDRSHGAATTIGASRPKGGSWISPNRGILVWRVPSGRRYTTTRTEYSV